MTAPLRRMLTTLAPVPEGSGAQYRLVELQLFNWGTFHDHSTIPVPRDGILVTGDSGSGKSTALDAHAMLLTPPKLVRLNVAAEGEGGGRDRNLLSYVRGAWGQEHTDAGVTTKVLREGPTWSAIAETYATEDGRAVTIAQVFWVRSTSQQSADIQRAYVVIERPLSLKELKPFADDEFDRVKLRVRFPEALIVNEFSPYSTRFRKIVGMDNDTALKLLHKTQSAKNLGDLNTFLRDFMLDTPKTFETAKRAVDEFTALRAAHTTLVTTRKQRDHLRKARELMDQRAGFAQQRDEARGYEDAVAGYARTRRVEMLEVQEEQLASVRGETAERAEVAAREAAATDDLLNVLKDRQRDAGDGGLEHLSRSLTAAQSNEASARRHFYLLQGACTTLAIPLPASADAFRETVASLEAFRAAHVERQEAAEAALLVADRAREAALDAKREAERELRSLQSQASNIPATLLQLRNTMATALQIPTQRLPFLGQLLEVRPEEQHWQGAIERALGSDTRTVLVGPDDRRAVLQYLKETFLGGKRLQVLTTRPPAHGAIPTPATDTIGRKLLVAAGPFNTWLQHRLATTYTHLCTNDIARYDSVEKAVTESGLYKASRERHTKDDTFPVTDQARWCLGFSNASKIALYQTEVARLSTAVRDASDTISRLREERGREQGRVEAARVVMDKQWSDVDVVRWHTEIASLERQIAALQVERPDIAELARQIAAQKLVVDTAKAVEKKADGNAAKAEEDYQRCVAELHAARALPPVVLGDATRVALDRLFAEYPSVSLDTLNEHKADVAKRLQADRMRAETVIAQREAQVTANFTAFAKEWPAAASDLPTTFESADSFLAMLMRIEAEDLPRFEQTFQALLRDHTMNQLIQLVNELDAQRDEIPLRLQEVNESLARVEYNKGTSLSIRTDVRPLRQVQEFRAQLRQCTEGLTSTDEAVALERFGILENLIKRLGADDRPSVQWRELVLDVRQHVEFIAVERDEDGNEVDVYKSGAGKSGGQRQILTATVLAAALRYKLGGVHSDLPTFATVVLDEAFDKADTAFTERAMNIFRRLGFQMIIATPNKSIQTLSAFVGGVCVVSIADRRFSGASQMLFDPMPDDEASWSADASQDRSGSADTRTAMSA